MVAIVGGGALGLARSSASILGAMGQLGSASAGRLGSAITVNAVTGNLVIQNQDELLSGVGVDAAVMRTYNSLGLMNDDNGDNWRHSGQRKVEVVTAGAVLRLTDWDGSSIDFTWDAAFVRGDGGTGAYVSKAGGGAYDWITYAGETWTLTDGDSLATQTFAEGSAGRITGQRDASGNLLTFAYDGSNRLTSITTANGESTDLVWDGDRLMQVTTRTVGGTLTGAKTRYAYDAQGRLSSVTIDLSPGDNSIADGKVVTYEYTYDGTSKRVASIAETGSGNLVSFTYVQVGNDFRVASVTEAMFSEYLKTTSFSYDTAARRTTVTDALGKVRVIAYDAAGNITSITSPADGTGAAPVVVQFGYNANGDVVGHTDGLGRITTYTYDAHGNVTESVDPAGNRMRYEYNSKNLLLKKVLVVNTGGLTRLPGTSVDTVYYLAANGDLLNAGELVDPVQHYTLYGWREGRNPNAMFNTAAYLAANPDVAAAGVNPLEHFLEHGWREGRTLGGGLTTAEYIARLVNETTRYAYDSVGRLRFEVTTEGRVTEFRYNALGQKTSRIQYTKNWYPVGWTLNSTDNVTEAQVAAWVAALGSTAAIQRTDTTYDFRGNVASEVSYADLNVNRLGNTGFQQGQTGWLTGETQPNMLTGSTTGIDAATGKAFHELSFNGISSPQWVTIYSGNDASAKVQPGERLAVRVGVGSTGPTPQLTVRMQFFGPQNEWLGESSNLTVLEGNVPFGTLMSGFTEVPQGAAWGRIVVLALAPAGSSGMTLRITEPMIAQVPAGETALPAYSPGMVGTQQSTIGSASYNRVTYTYDQYGQLLAKTTSGTVGSEVYTYDGLGRVLSATDLAGAVTTTAYNDSARTTTVTLANGLVKLSQYDAQGNVWTYSESGAGVPTATETYKYDKLGRLRYHGDALGFRDFTFYDEAGRKTGYMDEKGQLTEFRYDAANRLVATIRYANQVTAAASYVLYLDRPDTPVTITGARPAASNYDRWEWTVYDAANRVVQKIETVRGAWEGQSARVTSYTYDRAGNLDKTVESANVLSPAQVAQLMVQTPGTNLLKNPGFEGTTGWSTWNDSGIIAAGSPFAGQHQYQHYFKANFTATSAGQAASLCTADGSSFAVTPGQQLSVKTGAEAIGPVANLNLVVWWFDANGQPMYYTSVKTVNGEQGYGTQLEGLVTVPAGAASARLEMYMTASGAGSGWFVLIEPKVSVVSQGLAANLWQNTGFDNGTYSWHQWGTAGINFQSPLTVTTDAKGRKAATANFQATSASNNSIAIYTDSVQYFAPTAEEGLVVSAEVASSGAIDRLEMWVEYWDANNNWLASKQIGVARGVQPGGMQLSGFVDKGPANAKWVRVLTWAVPSAANTNASFSVRNLSVSTQSKTLNLWRNAAFEQGTQYWNQWGHAPQVSFNGNPTITTDSAGNRAIQTTFRTSDVGHIGLLFSDSTQFLDLVPGQRLAISANITAVGPVAQTYIEVGFFDANWQLISSAWIGSVAGERANPTNISGFVDSVPANAKYARIHVGVVASGVNSDITFSASELMVTKAEPGQTVVPVFSRNYDRPPVHVPTPTGAIADRITRNFYSKDGLLIGQLDGVGGFTQYAYDRAKRLTRTTRYANLTPSGLWASGTFSQILGVVGSAKDRTEYTVYDGSGRVRFRIDANLRPTEYIYNAAGQVIRTIDYAGSIAVATEYTLTSVRSQIAQLGLASNAGTRITRSVYDGAGRLNFTIDALGGVTSHVYDNSTGLVVRSVRYANAYGATDDPTAAAMWAWANGNQSAQNAITRSAYDKLGRLVYAIDAEGYITEYQYDLEGQVLKEIRYPEQYGIGDGATVSSIAGQIGAAINDNRTVVKTFAYDAAGQLTDSWDGEGVRTRFEYNAFGQVWRTVLAVGTPDEVTNDKLYDTAGRVLNEFFAVGTAEQTSKGYAYDGVGNLTVAVLNNGGNPSQTWYAYDANGNRLSQTNRIDNVTGADAASHFEYNAFGELVKTTDPRGGVTISDYNKLGQVSSVTDALGYVTSYAYNPLGTLQSVARAGATTAFEYDKLGRVTQSTDALGNYESFGYDAFGNRTSQTNKVGGTTTYAYDRRGLLVSEALPIKSYDNAGNASFANVTNTYAYDARGNLRIKVEASGLAEARTTQYAYDKANRVRQTTGQTFHGITPVSYVYYDGRGNVTSTVDPAGGRTVYYYDDLNRVTAEISATGTYTAYTYDLSGNVETARVYGEIVDVPGDGGAKHEAPPPNTMNGYRETVFTYDALGRMIASRITGVTSGVFNGSGWAAYGAAEQDMVTRYEYDANGNVVKATDAQGNSTWSYYDALNRKVAQVDGEGYLTRWDYNADGNVTYENRYANKVGSASPLTLSTSLTSAQLESSVSASSSTIRQTEFAYDAVGNRVSEKRYNVAVHDGAGGYALTTASIYYLYNGLGQVMRKTEASGDQVNYTYDVAGRLTTEARAAFVDQSGAWVTPTVDYYYDGLGNLSRTRARGSANAAERVTVYGYDGGKLRWIRDAERDDGNFKDGKMTWYSYDQAGRLIQECYDRYDSNGVLTKAADGSTAVYEGVHTVFDAAGRVTQKWQAAYNGTNWIDGAPRLTTTYNAYGEVATVSYGGVLQQQNEYDNAGRLTATNSGDGVWKYFGYDRNGNQTVAITSAGFNLAGQGFWGALSRIGQSDVNATYTRYDKRNMATFVTEEGRQFSVGGGGQTLNTERTYNAYGEVASEKNAALAEINYTYNNMGRLIKTESPLVEITLEDGTKTNVRPTEQYYYDASGRLVATRDANNNLTRLTLLAGTGYGGGQTLITGEIHADGGVKTTKYDIHGDARQQTDELGRSVQMTYDAMGRMTQRQELRNLGTSYDDLIDTYVYDGQGQALKHGNNVFQIPIYGESYWVEDYDDNGNYIGSHEEQPIVGYAPEYQSTDFDIQGRVVSARAFGGDVTTTSYVWQPGQTTAGLGTFGGWEVTTTMANGLQSIQRTDMAGRATYKRDLGGHETSYAYDAAGRLAATGVGGLTTSLTWLNSGLLGKSTLTSPNAGAANTNWSRDVATYTYDVVGNRLTELYQHDRGVYVPEHMEYVGPSYKFQDDDAFWILVPESYSETTSFIKNASASYDALGRMRSWAEAGTGSLAAASIANEYDAAGNVRRTYSTYRTLDANGAASASPQVRDYWFRYDNMNRVVVNQGQLSGSTIVRGVTANGAGGQDITYNLAGQRMSVTTTKQYYDYNYIAYTQNSTELYTYDEAGRLIQTRQLDGNGATGPGMLRSLYGYDLLGRQISQSDYNAIGTQVVYSRSASYNNKGQLTGDYTSSLKTDGKTYTSSTGYAYSGAQGYMLGAVVSQSSTNWVSGGSTTWSSTTNSYVWYDGALQSTISYRPNTAQSTTYVTSFAYNTLGQLTSAYIADGKPRSVSFTNDELGQIVRRDEGWVSGQTGAPHEVWYRFNGRQLGYSGNNGTSDMAMAASIADRQVAAPTDQGTFRNKQKYGASYADFAQNYDPINSYSQGSAGGSYTVQPGDTLQSIAQSAWGDAALWYKIAEANGLGAASALVEGQRLTLPVGVIRNTNNAATTNPYNPAEAMGDLAPTTSPKPQAGKKCGLLGAILIAVVAIAVTAWIGPEAISFFKEAFVPLMAAKTAAVAGAVVGGAAAAAAGSIVSQGVGVATGIQDKFSWKAVGLAALGGAVGGAMQGVDAFGKVAQSAEGSLRAIANAAVRGAMGSAITQGIGVATGLQDKFSWAGVAAAGVAGAIGQGLGKALDLKDLSGSGLLPSNIAAHGVVGAASLIASAATRSAIEGSSFGDNIVAGLPDVIGQVVGRALGGAANKAIEKATAKAAEAKRNAAAGKAATIGQVVEGAISLNTLRYRSNGLSPEQVSLYLSGPSGGELAAQNGAAVRALTMPGGTAANQLGYPSWVREAGPAADLADWSNRYINFAISLQAHPETPMEEVALLNDAFSQDFNRLISDLGDLTNSAFDISIFSDTSGRDLFLGSDLRAAYMGIPRPNTISTAPPSSYLSDFYYARSYRHERAADTMQASFNNFSAGNPVRGSVQMVGSVSEYLFSGAGALLDLVGARSKGHDYVWNADRETSDVLIAVGPSVLSEFGALSRLGRVGSLAADSETVIFNNGWRTLDGKFASPLGAGRAGGSAEVGVWDAIAAKPGWSVRTGNVAVRDASGQLRYYDGIAISPRDRIIGLEVKSGDASRTAAQRLFDTTLNSSPSNVATGVGQSAGTTVQRSILIRP